MSFFSSRKRFTDVVVASAAPQQLPATSSNIPSRHVPSVSEEAKERAQKERKDLNEKHKLMKKENGKKLMELEKEMLATKEEATVAAANVLVLTTTIASLKITLGNSKTLLDGIMDTDSVPGSVFEGLKKEEGGIYQTSFELVKRVEQNIIDNEAELEEATANLEKKEAVVKLKQEKVARIVKIREREEQSFQSQIDSVYARDLDFTRTCGCCKETHVDVNKTSKQRESSDQERHPEDGFHCSIHDPSGIPKPIFLCRGWICGKCIHHCDVELEPKENAHGKMLLNQVRFFDSATKSENRICLHAFYRPGTKHPVQPCRYKRPPPTPEDLQPTLTRTCVCCRSTTDSASIETFSEPPETSEVVLGNGLHCLNHVSKALPGDKSDDESRVRHLCQDWECGICVKFCGTLLVKGREFARSGGSILQFGLGGGKDLQCHKDHAFQAELPDLYDLKSPSGSALPSKGSFEIEENLIFFVDVPGDMIMWTSQKFSAAGVSVAYTTNHKYLKGKGTESIYFDVGEHDVDTAFYIVQERLAATFLISRQDTKLLVNGGLLISFSSARYYRETRNLSAIG
ncbi:hypothetical protein BJ508DRAFT_378268 [Ascobolus immersus RN42]|uniref:Uncharacterized protein n=1 Tax=Ascobolus immersus RN42 TaxID=1160509 RepID=A0A3N4I9W0_ASCIM|nr:hypothetical protein BJ508DRAFT_378268 [Ascobolus immersus RN42]